LLEKRSSFAMTSFARRSLLRLRLLFLRRQLRANFLVHPAGVLPQCVDLLRRQSVRRGRRLGYAMCNRAQKRPQTALRPFVV
jgi:hypothetical protein